MNKLLVFLLILFLNYASAGDITPETPIFPEAQEGNEIITNENTFSSVEKNITNGSGEDFVYESKPGKKVFIKTYDRTGKPVILNLETGKEAEREDLNIKRTNAYDSAFKDYSAVSKEMSDLLTQRSILKERLRISAAKGENTSALSSEIDVLSNRIDELKPILSDKEKNLRIQRDYVLDLSGSNLNTNEEVFLKNEKIISKGRDLINRSFFTKQKDGSFEGNKTIERYQNNFGESPDLASKDEILKGDPIIDPSLAKLKIIYDTMDELESIVRSKAGSSKVKCYASRELIPSYKCSIPNSSLIYNIYTMGLSAEERLKITPGEIKLKCEEDCIFKSSCISKEISTEIERSFNNTKEIFPNNDFSETEANLVLLLDPSKELETISFEIKIEPSSLFNDKNQTFEEFLQENKDILKERFSIVGINEDGFPTYITSSDAFLESRILKFSFPARNSFSKLLFTFYDAEIPDISKKYIFNKDLGKNILKDVEIKANIGKVTADSFRVKYRGKTLYFCPMLQSVPAVNEDAQYSLKSEYCESGRILNLEVGNSNISICLDQTHMIGPDSKTGGFYSEDKCEAACIQKEECIPSYPNTNNMTDEEIYKVEVGCVKTEDKSNSSCVDDLCKSYFLDKYKKPINEVVVQGDETQIATVKNGVPTGIDRPKIDFNRELGEFTSDSYTNAKIVSTKDGAYRYMAENGTYNRVRYKIGVPSPERQAYNIYTDELGDKHLDVLFKPSSDLIDTNNDIYLYTIAEIEETYLPIKYRSIDRYQVLQTDIKPKFKDKTFLIKKEDGDFEVFKKIFMDKIGVLTEEKICENEETRENCHTEKTIVWSDYYDKEPKVVKYDYLDDHFLRASSADIAPSYKKVRIWSKDPILKERLSDNLDKDIAGAPGAIIRSQKELTDSYGFIRVYKGDYNSTSRGYLSGINIYHISSKDPLTILDIENKLRDNTDKYLVWSSINQKNLAKEIETDEEFKNNIKILKLGKPENTTIQLEVTPDATEDQKNVFYFMFLKGENFKP